MREKIVDTLHLVVKHEIYSYELVNPPDHPPDHLPDHSPDYAF